MPDSRALKMLLRGAKGVHMPKKKRNNPIEEAEVAAEEVAAEKKAEEAKDKPSEDLDSLVNSQKIARAVKAVNYPHLIKRFSAEEKLAGEARAKGLSHDAQIVYIYKGLGGLVDKDRALINRANEAKELRRQQNLSQ
jgi:hypothetical protein